MGPSKNFSWPLMVNNVEREDLDLLIEYLKQDDPKLTHGPKVREFEEAWSKWLGVKHSVMLNSGSSANDLTMLALKYSKGGGEVIVCIYNEQIGCWLIPPLQTGVDVEIFLLIVILHERSKE